MYRSVLWAFWYFKIKDGLAVQSWYFRSRRISHEMTMKTFAKSFVRGPFVIPFEVCVEYVKFIECIAKTQSTESYLPVKIRFRLCIKQNWNKSVRACACACACARARVCVCVCERERERENSLSTDRSINNKTSGEPTAFGLRYFLACRLLELHYWCSADRWLPKDICFW